VFGERRRERREEREATRYQMLAVTAVIDTMAHPDR
jgi:hypothetical protein